LRDDRQHTVFGVAQPMGAMVLKSRPGRIPWSAIDRWCQRHRLNDADAVFIERCVRILDDVYLTWWAEKEAK